MLRTKGEPLTADDVDNLLCEINIDGDNRIKISEFVEHMFATSAPDFLPLIDNISVDDELSDVESAGYN